MKKVVELNFIMVVIVAIFISCNNAPKKKESTEKEKHEVVSEKKKDCNEVHWSHHEGEEGPENWKNLCDGFVSCGGQAQSPIDIVTTLTTEGENLKPFDIKYASSTVDIINNGHTVQFNMHGENTVTIQDKEYKLLQFHYHANSEHTIDGNYYPLEVHFVHKHSDTDFAVIGIMFQEGDENNLFTSYLANFPTEKGKFESEELINIGELMPENMSYYHYSGSLTTPPCSEVVNWYVLKNPLSASKEQIEKFSHILHENYRPIMPLNERKIFSKDI